MKVKYKLFAILLIFLSLAVEAFNSAQSNEPPKTIDQSFYKISDYDIVYGQEDAPIKVLDYYSLTCPHCAYFQESLFPKIYKTYIETGKVQWIKRIYVMDPQGTDGGMLIFCVDKLKRENYLKILLSKRSNWVLAQDYQAVLENIARLGGMSEKDFKACMDNKQLEENLKLIALKARKAGINGTPMIYVNGERLFVDSEKSFSQTFDKLLDQKDKK